jgi:putative flippase GtrA
MERVSRVLAQFAKFGLVGLSNTAITYGVYAALVYAGLYYIAASVIGFFIGVLNSFFWNSRYVFRKEPGQERSALSSLVKTCACYAFTGLVMHNLILYIMIDVLAVSEYAAPLFSLLVTVPLNYILNRQWAFRPAKRGKGGAGEKDQRAGPVL